MSVEYVFNTRQTAGIGNSHKLIAADAPLDLDGLIVDLCTRRTFGNTLHAIAATRFRIIRLTGTNGLAIGRRQAKGELSRCRCFLFESVWILGVLLHRFDTVHAARFGFVPFAAQDILAICGLQAKSEFTCFIFVDFELSWHFLLLLLNDKRDFHGHSVCSYFAVINDDLLFLDPSALNLVHGIGHLLDSLANRVLKAAGR
jgi:hypothetical protein